ncbi:hypothetical protein PV328_001107 [Microctonus aethiopoides]|uniref:NADH dehydrogenase [ubiquinone] 1 alpha subcomplex subunit 10, mitochondrial n=2 Tax=Microctonus aethiopoides TaxID=144406 RepID=A0AA39FWV2_9HYME|nr:hypothetical protein PV328_001107 [Microctonus aethiopoides]
MYAYMIVTKPFQTLQLIRIEYKMISSNITSALRTGYPQLLNFGRISGLCKMSPTNIILTIPQTSSITGKAMRVDRPPRPPPFDWKNKNYRIWHTFTDPMDARFDDNSKIVIVEGLPAVGKDKFAKKLAEELEMLYVPQPRFDDIFISPHGFDYRTLNEKLPDDAQYFDEKMFLANPYHRNTCAMQHTYYQMRYDQYVDALAHVFSTGQGVVLQRSPWSDMVFMKAMHSAGYVSKQGFDYYKSSLAASLHQILKPHLIIYLDIPSSMVKQRIQKRALPHELNSEVLTPKYLQEIETNYKNIYLPDISKHAHVLIYHWVEEADMWSIVDDIEELQFDGYDRESSKMADWSFSTLDMRRAARTIYTNRKEQLLDSARVVRYDVPEMLISPEDQSRRQKLLDNLAEEYPSHKYQAGFDPNSDKGILWKD